MEADCHILCAAKADMFCGQTDVESEGYCVSFLTLSTAFSNKYHTCFLEKMDKFHIIEFLKSLNDDEASRVL